MSGGMEQQQQPKLLHNVADFCSPQEEIIYLRNKLEELQQEFQEFQESSRELELEYDTQIKQLEKKNAESQALIERLQEDNEQLRSRYNSSTKDTQSKLNEYQAQIADLSALNNRLTSYVRELEQNNDDLERTKRALAASLEDTESQLNQQIERNVLLENEVSEKEELVGTIQRFKEEIRDLQQELFVKTSKLTQPPEKVPNGLGDAIHQDNHISHHNKTEIDNVEQMNGFSTPNLLDPNKPSQDVNQDHARMPHIVDSTTSPHVGRASMHSSPSINQNSNETYSSSQFTSSPSSNSTESRTRQTSNLASPTQPSTRQSALSIISDLLRKVGALESKISKS